MDKLEYVIGKLEFVLAVIAISISLDLVLTSERINRVALVFIILGIIQLVSLGDNLYRWRRHILLMYIPLWILLYCSTNDPAFILLSVESAIIYILLQHLHIRRLIHGLDK